MTEIRLVEKKDIKVLAEIMSESFTAADPNKPWDVDHAQKYLAYWLKKQSDMFFGAFDEGKPIGVAVVNIKPWRTSVRCTDGVVFVATDHQKSGVGSLLLKKVLEKAMKEYGATEIEAITFAGEEFPLEWYKRLGLAPDSNAVLIKGKCQEVLENLS